MNRRSNSTVPLMPRETGRQAVALGLLLLMGAWVLMGPSGLVAWGESHRQLAVKQAEIKDLTQQRDLLKNRVSLLDPRRADPDLTGELLRSNLNVVHPDEMVLQIKH